MTTKGEALSRTEQFLRSLTDLKEFDERNVRVVVKGQLGLTDDEKCFITIYSRVRDNVESLLVLDNVKHFQAIASISRTIFELAVDIRLLSKIEDAPQKMMAAVEVEKFRAAQISSSSTTPVPLTT